MKQVLTLLCLIVLATAASGQPDPADLMHMYRIWPVQMDVDYCWEIWHSPAENADLFLGEIWCPEEWWDLDGDEAISVGDVFYESRYSEQINIYVTVQWVGFGTWAYGGAEPFAFEAEGYPPPADWTGMSLMEVTPNYGDLHVVTGFVPDEHDPQFESDGQWYDAYCVDMVVQCLVTWEPWVATEPTSWSGVKNLFE